jgi:hypothetical protein
MGAVLRIRIRDRKKSGSGKNIPDPIHCISESLDPVPIGPWIRDGKIESGINIPDP